MNSSKKKVIFIGIVFLQITMFIYVGNQKKGFHIDEIYSHILSNSYNADRIASAEWMWGKNISGTDFNEFITVQENEKFAYQKVYYNNSKDCHPPFYYWILHSICSIFPNQFSKWFGIGLNIFLYCIASFLIYMISKELIENEFMGMLPVLLYGFSKFAVDTVTFIRMYMLLEVFTLFIIYIHIKMFKCGVTLKKIILVWITIFFSTMTHYYSIVLNFWVVLLFCCYLLRCKQIKSMFLYGSGSLVSVIFMFICYPYAIVQATGSSTNGIGNEVVKNLFNFKLWVMKMFSIFKEFISYISYNLIISMCVFFMLCAIFIWFAILSVDKRKKIVIDKCFVSIIAIIILVFLSITFIGGENVYLRYIYNIIPLIYIVVITLFDKILSKR